jgi:ABC-2 type transport system ATP-binding protein
MSLISTGTRHIVVEEGPLTSEPLIVENVVRRFQERTALNEASFSLRRGECLALLGPNGAGKTTLIRVISGRLKPDSGTVQIHGRLQTPGGDPELLSSLGIIPQNIALYENLTARENMELFGRVFGVSRAGLPAKIRESLEWTELADRADEPVSGFSGGMQRRLNIACGILHDPAILLLDEPTVGVDPQSRQRIWLMLRQLQDRGVSIVLTTHQLDEAQQICDRIVIMDRGRTIATGTFDSLVDASIGRRRKVVFTVAGGVNSLPEGFQQRTVDTAECSVENVADELPQRLQQFAALGLHVTDLSVEAPTLQAVFLHYTGHALRESSVD